MKQQPTPLSDRVRATSDDADLVREVEALERLAAAGTAHAVANNKHPKDWPLERWLAVLTFAMAVSGAIVGGIWVAGGEWRQVQSAVASVPMLIEGQASTRTEVQRIGIVVTEIQEEQQRRREADVDPPVPARRRSSSTPMAFPPDEQFNATERRQ